MSSLILLKTTFQNENVTLNSTLALYWLKCIRAKHFNFTEKQTENCEEGSNLQIFLVPYTFCISEWISYLINSRAWQPLHVPGKKYECTYGLAMDEDSANINLTFSSVGVLTECTSPMMLLFPLPPSYIGQKYPIVLMCPCHNSCHNIPVTDNISTNESL